VGVIELTPNSEPDSGRELHQTYVVLLGVAWKTFTAVCKSGNADPGGESIWLIQIRSVSQRGYNTTPYQPLPENQTESV